MNLAAERERYFETGRVIGTRPQAVIRITERIGSLPVSKFDRCPVCGVFVR
jgi:hypothetical protein